MVVPVSVSTELSSHIDLGLYVVLRYFSYILNPPSRFSFAITLLISVLSFTLFANFCFPQRQQLSLPIELYGYISILNSIDFVKDTDRKPLISFKLGLIYIG